jgi:hypothetical protein
MKLKKYRAIQPLRLVQAGARRLSATGAWSDPPVMLVYLM